MTVFKYLSPDEPSTIHMNVYLFFFFWNTDSVKGVQLQEGNIKLQPNAGERQ